MPTAEFIQLIIVALVAGYVGYLLGRASAGSAVRKGDMPSSSPLPEPVAPEENQPRERRSQVPPPAGAGGSTPPPTQRTTPRRSSSPPPAAAGLLNRKDE